MERLAEEDVLDPHPDIHALFCYYNSLYFGESLDACSVSWSSSRMTRCAGVCHYRPGGGCEIRLSEPLLKFRPTADLKNTLLHEMIHAFLWIANQNRDHSDHGPCFQRLMNGINCSSLEDHQKPAGGYNVTVYHEFHAEVDKYQVHRWMCESCGDLIKRAMNRPPMASDCIGKVKHGGPCGNPYCHWHSHRASCSGRYVKIAEPTGFKGRRALKGDAPLVRKVDLTGSLRTITSFFPVEEDKRPPPREDLKAMLPDEAVPRGKRSQCSGRRKRKFTEAGEGNCGGPGPEYSVMSGWLHWYAEEHEGEEDPEPLVNKRTQRRKKQKMMLSRGFPEKGDDDDGDKEEEELRSSGVGRMIVLEILDD
ncbi:unnamed protein product [Spirodela intermedia]|uniref:SprT-like domain-containing protein n=1 Tax=Spirodela intermedia TaxID=51605 RepID=A0A7I8J3K8_SPIIN|nr:unnamed protein product [Spirodela intermedia]CAA6664838.1 unnamed protein product [Spirodela intermedia]